MNPESPEQALHRMREHARVETVEALGQVLDQLRIHVLPAITAHLLADLEDSDRQDAAHAALTALTTTDNVRRDLDQEPHRDACRQALAHNAVQPLTFPHDR